MIYPHKVVVPKEDKLNSLTSSLEEFEKSESWSVCIDLSHVKMIVSSEIGKLVRFVQISSERKGNAYFYVENNTIEELLKTVNLDVITKIITDKNEFEAICNGPDSAHEPKEEKPLNKEKISENKDSAQAKPKPEQKKSLIKKVLTAILIFIDVMALIILSLGLVYEYNVGRNIQKTIIKSEADASKRYTDLNKKYRELQRRIAELELLNELEE